MKGRAQQALASALHFDSVQRAPKTSRVDALAVNAQHAVQQVVQHRRTGTATQRRRIPRSRFPKTLESTYASKLSAVIAAARSSVQPLLDELPKLLPSKKTNEDAGGGAFLSRELDFLDNDGSLPSLEVFDGIPLVIEYHVGDVRHWTNAHGQSGDTVMRTKYGYIPGSRGADGEALDVYVGLSSGAPSVYVVDQMKAPDFTEFDEQKVMLGFDAESDARDAYLVQYDDPRFLGKMIPMSLDEFKRALVLAPGARMFHVDAGESKRARDLVDQARSKLENAVHPNAIERLARDAAHATDNASKAQLAAQSRAALGVELHTLGRDIPAKIDDFVHENVALIKTMKNGMMDKVESLVTRAFTDGQSNDELAEELEKRFGIAERHAKLIARDQIGKLNSKLNRSRHEELGITRFTWRTVGDSNVRPEHDELNNEEFSYDDPPDEGLPGEPIACRCTADPVFDMLRDAVDDEESDDTDDDGDDDSADSSDDTDEAED